MGVLLPESLLAKAPEDLESVMYTYNPLTVWLAKTPASSFNCKPEAAISSLVSGYSGVDLTLESLGDNPNRGLKVHLLFANGQEDG
jgi:hypothetical protein